MQRASRTRHAAAFASTAPIYARAARQGGTKCHEARWHLFALQVHLVREKSTRNVYAMKKLKKSEMLRRGQVDHVKARFAAFRLPSPAAAEHSVAA